MSQPFRRCGMSQVMESTAIGQFLPMCIPFYIPFIQFRPAPRGKHQFIRPFAFHMPQDYRPDLIGDWHMTRFAGFWIFDPHSFRLRHPDQKSHDWLQLHISYFEHANLTPSQSRVSQDKNHVGKKRIRIFTNHINERIELIPSERIHLHFRIIRPWQSSAFHRGFCQITVIHAPRKERHESGTNTLLRSNRSAPNQLRSALPTFVRHP